MSELDDLVQLLRSKTIDRKLKWRLDNDSRISTKQGDTTIDILEFLPQTGYALTIRNNRGRSIASKEYLDSGADFESVKSIFTEVQREALSVDEALSDLKHRLMLL